MLHLDSRRIPEQHPAYFVGFPRSIKYLNQTSLLRTSNARPLLSLVSAYCEACPLS